MFFIFFIFLNFFFFFKNFLFFKFFHFFKFYTFGADFQQKIDQIWQEFSSCFLCQIRSIFHVEKIADADGAIFCVPWSGQRYRYAG